MFEKLTVTCFVKSDSYMSCFDKNLQRPPIRQLHVNGFASTTGTVRQRSYIGNGPQ